jgi:hypothetical protein
MRAISVHLARLNARHKDMPVVISTVPVRVEQDDPRRFNRIRVIEQEQLDQGCTFRE